jgi:hypothetical protein
MLAALNERDVESLRSMIAPDVVSTSPQSGERSAGFEAFLQEGDNYPGGTPEVAAADSKLIGDDERWVISPSYTVIPMASPTSYTAVMKVRYPDGRNWFAILLVELRDQKVASVESYYAPEMPAPLAEAISQRSWEAVKGVDQTVGS